MDSEGSSDGESGESDSRSPPPKKPQSGPRSPPSPDGPDSPDDDGSGQNSEVNSPDNFRPPSPAFDTKEPSDAESDGSSSADKRSPFRAEERQHKEWSPKSDSVSRPDSIPLDKSPDEKAGRRSRSASSRSSRSSSTREKDKYADNPPTEEISDGEMDSEHDNRKSTKSRSDKPKRSSRENNSSEKNLNMSHEDLSDVSDLDSVGQASDEDCVRKKSPIRAPDLSDSQESHSKLNEPQVNGSDHKKEMPNSPPKSAPVNISPEQTKFEKLTIDKSKTEDAEEQLDFEAEEGECLDTPAVKSNSADSNANKNAEKNKDDDEGSGAASSLEEGEVSDDEERRPEETEPRPVCRFYSRGQCTWGVSCRFLHPGVTDKGNYTMFDMVRSMPAGYGQHHQVSHVNTHMPSMGMANHPVAAAPRIEPPVAESAWERGLRTAKEMLRKACKRKEQDTDFEEKKMHLSLGGGGGRGGSLGPGGEEDDADLAAYAGYPPPDSPPVVKREREEYLKISERRYEDVGRLYNSRERSARYAERIPRLSPSPHRPVIYEDKVDDRAAGQKARRGRTTREVIVQRAPGTGGRGDEWADPWMRGGGGGGNRSPGRRRSVEKGVRRRRRYSSGSSVSSSSSSHSSSRSSNSTGRSGSIVRKSKRKASPAKFKRSALSPSVIVQERRAATARAVAMNPPAPSSRKRVPSPAATRQHAANPPAPQNMKTTVDEFGRTKPAKPKQRQKKMYSKSSSSGSDSSSSSSDSDSDSHSSSSSDNSAARKTKLSVATGRGAAPIDKKPVSAKIVSGNKMLSPKYTTLALNQKKEALENEARKDVPTAKKRAATSPVNDANSAKKPVSRREELLKQLKAVEDAIARKRSKI